MAEESTSNSTSTVAWHPRRIKLTDLQCENISKEELLKHWKELDAYVELLETQASGHEAEITSLRETEERVRQQHIEAVLREKVLVRRLASKEQEMQEYVNQVAELKAQQAPGAAALRSALLDPAVNLLLQRLRQELTSTKARLEETQNELSAWKFTPDSNTGKRLMAKCRLLYQENEELGRMISSGRLAKLEGELALQKSFSEEVKKSQSELDEFLQELDEDVEGMQSTIYYLQQELRKHKDLLTSLQQENAMLKNGRNIIDMKGESIDGSTSSSVCHNGVCGKGEDSADWADKTEIKSESFRESESKFSLKEPGQNTVGNESVCNETGLSQVSVGTPAHEAKSKLCLEEKEESLTTQTQFVSSQNEAKWERTDNEADDSSKDSDALILKVDCEDFHEEVDFQSSPVSDARECRNGQRDVTKVSDSILSRTDATECKVIVTDRTLGKSRKRTSPLAEDDDNSNDSDNVPLIKKVRRDSELSLHYDDGDDETTLTNGDVSLSDDNGK